MDPSSERKSLEKLTSPEQLDRLLIIIRMPGWIALLCLFALTLAIFAWSIFGRIAMTAEGSGIFFQPEAIELIQSQSEGVVSRVKVHQGDEVKQGAPLIVLQSLRLIGEEKEISERLTTLQARMEEEKAVRLEHYAIELKQQLAIYALQKQRLKVLEADPKQIEALYALQIAMKNQEASIHLTEQNIAHPDLILANYLMQIQELTELKRFLQEQIHGLTIHAPSDGTVMAVEILPGESVSLGKNLLWFQKRVEPSREPLVYSFFSLEMGESIKPGMAAQIEFNSVNADLYGKMVGKVIRVVPFTATARGSILKSIPSEKLREYLTHSQASMVVEIEPIQEQTVSGYRWTTQQGPPFPLAFGALAGVKIFIEERRPIDYLIPLPVDR